MTLPDMPPNCSLYYEQRYDSWSWKWEVGGQIVTRHSFRTPEDAHRDCVEFMSQVYSGGIKA